MSQGGRKTGPKVIMDALSAASNQAVVEDVGDCTSITLMFWWNTGSSLVGAFEVDILRRLKGVDGGADEWHPIQLSPAASVSGTSGTDDAVLTGDVRKIRVRYTKTSGTGNVYCSVAKTMRG